MDVDIDYPPADEESAVLRQPRRAAAGVGSGVQCLLDGVGVVVLAVPYSAVVVYAEHGAGAGDSTPRCLCLCLCRPLCRGGSGGSTCQQMEQEKPGTLPQRHHFNTGAPTGDNTQSSAVFGETTTINL